MTGRLRVTRSEWYAHGGFSNPYCHRRMRGHSWQYFIEVL